jgi:ATP-dependent Lon protease
MIAPAVERQGSWNLNRKRGIPMCVADEIWSGADQGTLRMFPLPGFVMFPHVAHPFHLFEPRYVALAEEAITDDRLIAMAVLKPGWETSYNDAPPVYPMLCVGHISAHSRSPQGTFNILLKGIMRASILEELPRKSLFRRVVARRVPMIDVQDDVMLPRLLTLFHDRLTAQGAAADVMSMLANQSLDLDTLSDIMTFSMVDSLDDRRSLLEQHDPVRRAERLFQLLAEPAGPDFPPPFSAN